MGGRGGNSSIGRVSSYYPDSMKADNAFRTSAIAEMRRYERNWNFMTAQEKRNISPNGIRELRARIKELQDYDRAQAKKK